MERFLGGEDGLEITRRIVAQAPRWLDEQGVLALERTEGGWLTRVEVLELPRVPSTTDVLAVFDVELDEKGEITNYRRTERYVRSQGGGGG